MDVTRDESDGYRESAGPSVPLDRGGRNRPLGSSRGRGQRPARGTGRAGRGTGRLSQDDTAAVERLQADRPEYTQEGDGDSEAAGTSVPLRRGGGRSHTRGPSQGRGQGRARGRGRLTGSDSLGQDDTARVERLQADRREYTQALIQGMPLEEAHNLLDRIFTRDPSLIFDLIESNQVHAHPISPAPGQPCWCTCRRCRDMPMDAERKCCSQPPVSCVSMLPLYILDPGVLACPEDCGMTFFALGDSQEPGADNRQFRNATYRQFVLWQHGALGSRNRVVIPSCCVWRIRDTFPDKKGHYVGFMPGVL